MLKDGSRTWLSSTSDLPFPTFTQATPTSPFRPFNSSMTTILAQTTTSKKTRVSVELWPLSDSDMATDFLHHRPICTEGVYIDYNAVDQDETPDDDDEELLPPVDDDELLRRGVACVLVAGDEKASKLDSRSKSMLAPVDIFVRLYKSVADILRLSNSQARYGSLAAGATLQLMGCAGHIRRPSAAATHAHESYSVLPATQPVNTASIIKRFIGLEERERRRVQELGTFAANDAAAEFDPHRTPDPILSGESSEGDASRPARWRSLC